MCAPSKLREQTKTLPPTFYRLPRADMWATNQAHMLPHLSLPLCAVPTSPVRRLRNPRTIRGVAPPQPPVVVRHRASLAWPAALIAYVLSLPSLCRRGNHAPGTGNRRARGDQHREAVSCKVLLSNRSGPSRSPQSRPRPSPSRSTSPRSLASPCSRTCRWHRHRWARSA